MTKRECEFCHNDFTKGTGHMCWCPECSVPHPMCDSCYKKGKNSGDIVDAVIPRNSITDTNKERYT